MMPRIFGEYEAIKRNYPMSEFLDDIISGFKLSARLRPDQLPDRAGHLEIGALAQHQPGFRATLCRTPDHSPPFLRILIWQVYAAAHPTEPLMRAIIVARLKTFRCVQVPACSVSSP